MIVDPNAKTIYSNAENHVLSIREADKDMLLISGMAEGWDEAIAKIGLRNNIPYDVYIPTKDYGNYYWGQHSLTGYNRMAMFEELVNGARRVVYMEDIYGAPKMTSRGPCYETSPGCLIHANMVRNSEMVKASTDALVYDAKSPGTRDAVAKLRKARVPFSVYPFTNKTGF